MSYANMDGVPTQTEGVSEILADDWNIYVRDNFDSIKFGHVVCTSSTRPTGVAEGTMIYETDTNKVLVYDGASWRPTGNVDVATSTTRPSPTFEGAMLYETDSNEFRIYDGFSWVKVADLDKLDVDTGFKVLSHTESKTVRDLAWYGGPLTPTLNTWVSSTGGMPTISLSVTVPAGKKWVCSFLLQARLWLLSAPIYNVWAGVDVSGATTIGADALPQANSARLAASSVYDSLEVNAAGQFTLNAGSNTITYVVKRDAGSFDIQNRQLFVSPLYEISA